jgi:hypothetical protein
MTAPLQFPFSTPPRYKPPLTEKRMVKRFIARLLLGDRNVGRLDYLLRRQSKDVWGGPFNGQKIRQQIYSDILSRVAFRAIVETGTFRGTTTEFFAKSGLPVYSVDLDPRAYGYASLRLFRQRHRVHLFQGHSPEFLRGLAAPPNFPRSKVFFYLDAHYGWDAPLVDELEIIFTKWTDAVVMVDDFQVPGTDYVYDDWGPGKTLNMAQLEPLRHLCLSAFFPAIDPKDETGEKRGCVVLCRENDITTILRGIETLTFGNAYKEEPYTSQRD